MTFQARRWFSYGLIVLFASCSRNAAPLQFTGTWTITRTNGITDQTRSSSCQVTVQNDRFRIVERGPETETTTLYDGKIFNENGNSGEKKSAQLEPLRFWKRSFVGTGIAGGVAAGRTTVLYQSQDNRPDGQLTMQAWVDAETGVVLKRIFTIYSTQVEQVTTRDVEECTDIHYGPVDEAAFSKL